MPHAIVLNTASKANTSGGTFADALTANSGDSLGVASYGNGGARIIEMWGIDSDSAAEFSIVYSRPEATHDQSRGLRLEMPSLFPGGAANVAGHDLLPGLVSVKLFRTDTMTVNVTSTANDDVILSWVTEYDDLPGSQGTFMSADGLENARKSTLGINVLAVASGTPGAYGAARAINTDDDRFHGDTWYAILGCSVRTPVTTISLIGPDWGGQRIGLPAGVQNINSTTYFLDQSIK